eukprot:TRINITY_DN3852_c0_g1_i1.p2 TRINITY_DN3852_c0_g1~~TRINITY_DN3852_c0_g1_i1.p2  ORF type:complete len:235 (-),score=32.84 TRINITY_DN3852_c0_g1_i1:16-720(-)
MLRQKNAKKKSCFCKTNRFNNKKIIVELQKKEGELRKEIKNKKQIEKQLEAEIRKLIEEEIRKRKKNNNSKVIKADNVLSSNFKENKGKLPWPLDNATVVAEFGEHGHAILKGVKVNNNGIDLGSSKQNSVKAVFTGEVSKIIRIPGTNVTVIIRHGNYLTVYQNLSEVKVKTGDKVSTGQIIGYADSCLLYTSDAADDMQCVDLGGRRIIKKKKICINIKNLNHSYNVNKHRI